MKKHSAAILASGCLWGTMGLFRRYLGDMGLTSSGLIIVRCGIAALLFAVTLLVTGTQQFKIRLRDFWCFLGVGIFSLLFFSFCYFQALSLMSLSAAAVLLYTAPAMVTLMSAVLFRERLTVRRLLSVTLAFLGCALVSGFGAGGARLSAAGVLYGLGAGFGYALYSIFARLALDRGYGSNTVNFYSCLLAAIGASVLWGVGDPVGVLTASWGNAGFCVLAAAVTCYLPYLLYTYGLSGMEAGRASVMASVEPVVATVLGAAVFHEALTPAALFGIALVLSAVALLNLKRVPAPAAGNRP